MRGKGIRFPCSSQRSGITPAYAGKRTASTPNSSLSRDHPRLCGEKQSPDDKVPEPSGSPPPMRGKGDTEQSAHLPHGITPAYAGKRLLLRGGVYMQRDHPRLCGEKVIPSERFTWAAGSPPPMRGKGLVVFKQFSGNGITPAYAGKRKSLGLTVYLHVDHPRLCGEKAMLVCLRRISTGSPPPMRGKAAEIMKGLQEYGITPAYAGKRDYIRQG